jgi:hypothetical protein
MGSEGKNTDLGHGLDLTGIEIIKGRQRWEHQDYAADMLANEMAGLWEELSTFSAKMEQIIISLLTRYYLV